MAAPRPKTLVRRWASEDPELEVLEDADVLILGLGGVEIEVETDPEGFDGLLLRNVTEVPARTLHALGRDEEARRSALARLVGRVAMARTGRLRGAADGTEVRLEVPIHADGLSHHTLAGCLAEIVKARQLFEAALAEHAMESLDVAELFREAERTATSEPSVAPASTTQEVWRATHVVADGGLPAYGEADPAAPPVAHLEPGVELRVVREWGAWAEVLAENGWRGWVDGRLLVGLR